MAFLVATTSLPAVYRQNDDRWNVARSCQYFTCPVFIIFSVKGTKRVEHAQIFFGIFLAQKNTGGTVMICARTVKIVNIQYRFFVKLQSSKK